MPLTVPEINDLVHDWTPRLYFFARQWTDAPEDAVQQAFLDLYRSHTRPGNVVAWLFKATRDAAMNLRRAERRRDHRENAAASSSPNWFVPNEDDRLDGETVTQKLQELPSELREVVVARLWGELTFEQIAVSMQTSTATAHRRYNEAIAVLRSRLKNDG